ncbi:MAG: hypothetical protein IPJ31_05790 [Bacteroidetes bacterium]|nr:hypothetical protein [Bacteroidota bacterium]
MKQLAVYLFVMLCMLFYTKAFAQTIIKGEVRDLADNSLMENVNVKNIYTQEGLTLKANGLFSIQVKKGELVEFSKVGYQTVRVRIVSEKEPEYYKIVLSKTPIELREVDIRGKPLDFKKDSVRYRKTYDIVMRKDRKEDVDMRSMPLAMLSKKNRQEWAFQEMYEQWEQEKYIDYVFNDKLVHRITYLEKEELQTFMKVYRPRYDFVRNVSEYEYLDYIKSCYYHFKKSK